VLLRLKDFWQTVEKLIDGQACSDQLAFLMGGHFQSTLGGATGPKTAKIDLFFMD
jgi:hypothetical protein